MRFLLAIVLGLAASTLAAFPFWLESPQRRNPADPKSRLWSPPPTPVTPAAPQFPIHWELRDFGSIHAGKDMGLRLADPAAAAPDLNHFFYLSTTAACNTSLVFGPCLRLGAAYDADIMAGFTVPGTYVFPGDHPYHTTVGPVTGPVNTAYSHSNPQVDIGAFDSLLQLPAPDGKASLVVDLSAFDVHVGQLVGFRLVEDSGGTEVVRFSIASLGYPSQQFILVRLLQPGMSYRFELLADFNANGAYDPPPADHAWRLLTGPVAGDLTLALPHTAPQQDIGPFLVP